MPYDVRVYRGDTSLSLNRTQDALNDLDSRIVDGGIDLGVRIEDDVWVGAGAIILRGVVIGRGSVIGAGSVVTRSVPEYSIAVGNPARVVKARFSDDDLAVHKELLDAAGR